MSINAFLKIDGIDGESTDDSFENWIDVITFSFGVRQTSHVTGGTMKNVAEGKATLENLSVTKLLDNTTPTLYKYCATNKSIPEVQFVLCKTADGNKVPYMEYTLGDVIITSIKNTIKTDITQTIETSTDDNVIVKKDETISYPIETVSFNYNLINWTYKVLNRSNEEEGKISTSFDVGKNK